MATGTQQSGIADDDVIRYLVVVHGMGTHRPGESLPAVVSRCAEARRSHGDRRGTDTVTLGMAVHGDQPWVQLEGIPQRRPAPGDPPLPPFVGRRSRSGGNLRFVDLHWADVLDHDDFQRQDLDDWVTGLIGRLELKDKEKADGAKSVPPWVMRVLYRLQETVILVQKAMSWRAKGAEDLIFNRILGDVQVYGEYTTCRGRAVWQFHERLAKVHEEHCKLHPDREARYVVVAHSLGSVLALDALAYAHARLQVRSASENGDGLAGLPFDGYCAREAKEVPGPAALAEEGEPSEASGRSAQGAKLRENQAMSGKKLPTLDWLPHVQSLVTLGSPIDKFLTVWWLRYRYLEKPDAWLDPAARNSAGPIPHFNYCEEQDPVGHELDLMERTAAYGKIFKKVEDRVYLRSSRPGIAHSAYWKDAGLFRRIVDRAVDLLEPPPADEGLFGRMLDRARSLLPRRLSSPADTADDPRLAESGDQQTSEDPPRRIDGQGAEEAAFEPRWFAGWTYTKTLAFSYLLLPLVVTTVTAAAFFSAWRAEGWRTAMVSGALFVLVLWVGRRLVLLTVWWRQLGRRKGTTMEEIRMRKALGWAVRLGLPVAAGTSLFAAAWALGVHWEVLQRNGVDLPQALLPRLSHALSGAEQGPGVLLGAATVLLVLVWQRWAQGSARRHGVGWSLASDLLTVVLTGAAWWCADAHLLERWEWANGWLDRTAAALHRLESPAATSFALAVVAVIAAATLTYTTLRFLLVKGELKAAGGPTKIASFRAYTAH